MNAGVVLDMIFQAGDDTLGETDGGLNDDDADVGVTPDLPEDPSDGELLGVVSEDPVGDVGMSGVVDLDGESILQAGGRRLSDSRLYPHSLIVWPFLTSRVSIGEEDPIQHLIVRVRDLFQTLKNISYGFSKKTGPRGVRGSVAFVGKSKSSEGEAQAPVDELADPTLEGAEDAVVEAEAPDEEMVDEGQEDLIS